MTRPLSHPRTVQAPWTVYSPTLLWEGRLRFLCGAGLVVLLNPIPGRTVGHAVELKVVNLEAAAGVRGLLEEIAGALRRGVM